MFQSSFINTIIFVAFQIITLAPCCVHAGWIDRDTPSNVRTIYSYYDVEKIESSVKKHHKENNTKWEFHLNKAKENKKRRFQLVFSDEFNTVGRSFSNGQDSRWTSLEKNDYTNDALHYYSDDFVTTSKANASTVHDSSSHEEWKNNGVLNITTAVSERTFSLKTKTDKSIKGSVTKYYGSGMLQSWNKFCFTGGIVEISAQLPGYYLTGGLWPAMWLMGNLARATYVGSSENMWPWSSDVCDRGTQKGQLLSACNRVNHFNLAAHQGRGAPEIDIMEAMPGNKELYVTPVNVPYFSSSFQVSPARKVEPGGHRPYSGARPDPKTWYHLYDDGNNEVGLTYGGNTSENVFFYGTYFDRRDGQVDRGYQADALSANTGLNLSHFNSFHTYRVEWELPGTMLEKVESKEKSDKDKKKKGDNDDGGGGERISVESKGYIRWYIDDEFVYGIDGLVFNDTGASIPLEPMYLILNTAVSSTWGFPNSADCPRPRDGSDSCFDCRNKECDCYVPRGMCGNLPAYLLIDYIRVYQDTSKGSKHTTGCSPRDYPTADYIAAHQDLYMSDTETQPLEPLIRGGGSCNTSNDCNSITTMIPGGAYDDGDEDVTYNHCIVASDYKSPIDTSTAATVATATVVKNGVCQCAPLYTGSHCKSSFGFEEITYSYDDNDIVWTLPPVANAVSVGVFVSIAVVSFTILVAYVYSHPQ